MIARFLSKESNFCVRGAATEFLCGVFAACFLEYVACLRWQPTTVGLRNRPNITVHRRGCEQEVDRGLRLGNGRRLCIAFGIGDGDCVVT